MFAREDLNVTLSGLGTLLKERDSDVEEVRVHPHEIQFQLDSADPTIKVGKKEHPATPTALQAFGGLLQIPNSFLKRAQDKVQAETMQAFMGDMLSNTLLKDARITLRSGYIQDVAEWGKKGIEPAQLVTAVANVLDEKSEVVRLIDSPAFFGFDVRVPEKSKSGVGGSGESVTNVRGKQINDITAGGVRVGLNMKQGLAPSVEEFLYRLSCTNGMTVQDTGLKVDARGQTVDEVIAEIEALAQIAFSRAERSIEHFYDLRNQPVDNVERTLRSIAREQGIPTRSTMALMDLAAGEDMPDDPSMFDVVNLVTNFANSPTVNRDGGRQILEGAGGAVVSDHATRCGHCRQKVTG